MYCAYLNKEIESKECPPIVTTIRSVDALKVCQKCPQGLALASYAQIVPNYYQPQKHILEKAMPEVPAEYNVPKEHPISEEVTISPAAETRRTYTLPELANLAGVKYSSAIRIRNGLDQSGRNAQKLNELMQNLGITWADVVKIPHGKRNQRNASQKEAEAHNLEKTMNAVVLAMEPEAEALLQEPKNVDLEKFDGDANKLIAALNDKPQEHKAVSPDMAWTLEHLLAEVKRRLPSGAKVRIEF